MPWSRKFAKPIVLKDGRTIATLADARDLMSPVEAGHQDDPAWRHARELLHFASNREDTLSLGRARAQLTRTLKAEGLI
jgi:hypothetical protein